MSRNYLEWDDFDIKKGDRVGFEGPDGKLLVGTVTSIEEDEETGEIRIIAK